MTKTDELLRRAEAHAETFDGSRLPARPAKQIAVRTCMDGRVNPNRLLGLADGDAHVIRHAGGVVTDDAIRSLAISQRVLGTSEIVVIHHTGCGMLAVTDDEFGSAARGGHRRQAAVGGRAFADLEGNVRDSDARLKASPSIQHEDAVRGFVYGVETGRLAEIPL